MNETVACEMVKALDQAAWKVGTAAGRIENLGYVQIDRIGQRRTYRLDGYKSSARVIYEKARGLCK